MKNLGYIDYWLVNEKLNFSDKESLILIADKKKINNYTAEQVFARMVDIQKQNKMKKKKYSAIIERCATWINRGFEYMFIPGNELSDFELGILKERGFLFIPAKAKCKREGWFGDTYISTYYGYAVYLNDSNYAIDMLYPDYKKLYDMIKDKKYNRTKEFCDNLKFKVIKAIENKGYSYNVYIDFSEECFSYDTVKTLLNKDGYNIRPKHKGIMQYVKKLYIVSPY